MHHPVDVVFGAIGGGMWLAIVLFAPDGERSAACGYARAMRRAWRVVHLEDQYVWSADVARAACAFRLLLTCRSGSVRSRCRRAAPSSTLMVVLLA
ncbi:MAG: hypothetical protein ACOH2F_04730 [Cellulomonas sp.]